MIICSSAEDALIAIKPRSIDMLLTDPPYGISWRAAHRVNVDERHSIKRDRPDDFAAVRDVMSALIPKMRPGAAGVWFCAGGRAELLSQWTTALSDAGWLHDHLLIWRKPGIAFGSRYRHCYETILITHAPGAPLRWFGDRSTGNVIDCKRERLSTAHAHASPKPVTLLRDLILNHTMEGDVVLDPFVGSGSTVVAAHSVGRRAIGIELTMEWASVAAAREATCSNAV